MHATVPLSPCSSRFGGVLLELLLPLRVPPRARSPAVLRSSPQLRASPPLYLLRQWLNTIDECKDQFDQLLLVCYQSWRLMDLTPFKKDIDELLDYFAKEGSTGFLEMKQLWLSRKFSYIFEGRPRTFSAIFMQGLYSHCIGHIITGKSLSHKVGALYCLYCLYETQPYKPLFKVYLSLGELKKLKDLVIDAKKNGIELVSSLVKRMLANCMFLFGFVDIFGASVAQRIDEITKQQDMRAQIAYEKLFADTKIEDYLHMDFIAEADFEELKKITTEYTKAKQQAIAEASSSFDVENVKHIADVKDPIEDKLQEMADTLDQHKQRFFKPTGIGHRKEIMTLDTTVGDDTDHADFTQELECLLTDE